MFVPGVLVGAEADVGADADAGEVRRDLQQLLRGLGRVQSSQHRADTGGQLGGAGFEGQGGAPEVGELPLGRGQVAPRRQQVAVQRQHVRPDQVVQPVIRII